MLSAIKPLRSTALLVLLILVLLKGHVLYAATGDTVEVENGIGIIIIKQETPLEGTFGEWTLLKPNNEQESKKVESHTLEESATGNYTIIIDPLEGATTTVRLHRNGKHEKTVEIPQIAFTLSHGDTITLEIVYTLTRVGTVAVSSDPPGMAYTLKGPNDLEFTGKTPESYLEVPEGQYTVYFDAIEGCVTPRPQSQRLVKDSRINLNIEVACEALEEMEQVVEEKKTLEYVSVLIDDETVIFRDVPMTRWYAPFINTVARTGISTGYRDERGEHTGEYGPANLVSIAELAKMAHRVAGIDETEMRGDPKNLRARGTWFERYFVSAEKRNWLIFFETRLDPGRSATRAEVVATLLQALDVPRKWPKGKMFTDVKPTTKYAASIETAAKDGLISGYTDKSGRATGEFGPNNPVNRAEVAKIISLAIELYIEDKPSISGETY